MNNLFSPRHTRLPELPCALLLVCAAGFLRPIHASTFSNFEAAKLVIGQTDFTSSSTTNTQSTTPYATNVALSSKGVLAISQSGPWGRALLFNTFPTTNGAPADVVVGKPDFTSMSGDIYPYGVAFSPDGNRLLMTDGARNRILIWNTIPTSNGQAPDVVIGQPDLNSYGGGTSSTKFSNPRGLTVTPSGQLLVADNGNSRVLIFNSIPTTNGAAADVVVGQSDFDSDTSGFAANQLTYPDRAIVSPDGKLLISDDHIQSVRIWNSVPTTNGASADVIIGQSDFRTPNFGTSRTSLYTPSSMSISPTGQLAISDYTNNRVLIYNSVPTTSGAAADVVLGQPNFTTGNSNTGGISARSMFHPIDVVFLPNGRLMTVDYDNHRVLVFGNLAPVIKSVVLAPNAPQTNDTLTATVVAADEDSPSYSLSYVWRKNGAVIEGQTASTLDLSQQGNGDRGDVITVTVTGSDGTDTGTSLTSAPVTVSNSAPEIVSLSPSDLTDKVGDKRTFSLTTSDVNGTSDIKEMWLLINERLSWDAGATLIYVPSSSSPTQGLLYLRRGDAFLPPITVGEGASASGVLDNGAVRVVGSDVSVTTSGDSLTLNIPATIRDGLVGQNKLFARVADRSDATDLSALAGDNGYRRFGSYTVTSQFSGTNVAPVLSKLSPSATYTTLNTSGIAPAAQRFVFYVKDDNGIGDIESVWFLAGNQPNWAKSATIVYQPRTRRLLLRSDDGQSWLGGGQIGSAGIIENSQVRIDLSKISVNLYPDGKSFGLTLFLQAKRGLLGSRNPNVFTDIPNQNTIWLRAQDRSGAIPTNSTMQGYGQGFVQSGVWYVGQQLPSNSSSAPSQGKS